jgi:3-methyladenine DNA glycosylase AlkD
VTADAERAREALAWLERHGAKRTREEMLTRYGITAPKAFGVPVGTIQQLAKRLGRDHDLAAALWETGWYEARMLTSFIDDPARVTAAQMDRWARDFDNWGICDTVCFALFDRTPHAWKKVERWHTRREEFVKRAAFALLWGLTVHDKAADDNAFVDGLGLIEQGATDERHFVKKAVNMALRAVGKRNGALNSAATKTAHRLAASSNEHAKWVGKDALRELTSPALARRIAAQPKR